MRKAWYAVFGAESHSVAVPVHSWSESDGSARIVDETAGRLRPAKEMNGFSHLYEDVLPEDEMCRLPGFHVRAQFIVSTLRKAEGGAAPLKSLTGVAESPYRFPQGDGYVQERSKACWDLFELRKAGQVEWEGPGDRLPPDLPVRALKP